MSRDVTSGDVTSGEQNHIVPIFFSTTLEKTAKAPGAPVSELFSGKIANFTAKSGSGGRLASLWKDASPEEQEFIIKTARFILRRKK